MGHTFVRYNSAIPTECQWKSEFLKFKILQFTLYVWKYNLIAPKNSEVLGFIMVVLKLSGFNSEVLQFFGENYYLKVTFTTKLFFFHKVALDVWINDFFYLKEKYFILEISRLLCFCEIHRNQNLWCHHKHCYIMEVTLNLISFEPCVLSQWNLVKY